MKNQHPLSQFTYCPKCGNNTFVERNAKAKECESCEFVYYFNPSSAVACFIVNDKEELLLTRRASNPAKGTLDLPGGFVDMNETAEEAARREVMEETGLTLESCQYIYSLPNLYVYSGFTVHTVDMFFMCRVSSFDAAIAADDAQELVIISPKDLNPELFGLDSIRKAIEHYVSHNI